MNPRQRDNSKDRKVGAHWEREFCNLAAQFGKTFTPHQIGRPDQSAAAYSRGPEGWSTLLLPDVTVWSAPGEHHEIKHKNRTRDGMYGLERYRLDALIRFANTTGQKVYYTIHDWEIAGAQNAWEEIPSHMSHWFVGDVDQLSRGCTKSRMDWTYYGGGQRQMEVCYWSASRLWFHPLGEVWTTADELAA